MKKIMMVAALALAGVVFAGKPIALMGFGTDVKTMKADVTDQSRYAAESMIDKWLEPSEYGKYSVLYFGEKLRGKAQGKNWKEGEARAAAEKFIADGGLVIVAGQSAMVELFGKPNRKKPDPLREKVTFIPSSLGRMKANYAKAKKPLSFPDDAGNDILIWRGQTLRNDTFSMGTDPARLPHFDFFVTFSGLTLGGGCGIFASY